MSEKPTCAVQGLVRRGAMCSQIIVGGKFCGYSGKCEHKRPPADAADGRCARVEPCECAPEAKSGCVSWRPNARGNAPDTARTD